MSSCHSPLTGIFLIRRRKVTVGVNTLQQSQSPDGDFFDPEGERDAARSERDAGHSPLTGIFLIRSPSVAQCYLHECDVTVP